MSDFEINDRRGSRRSASQAEANLRNRGFALPESPVMSKKIIDDTLRSVKNRELTSSMRRTGSTTRTGSSVQMAIPKVREPMSSLRDKNIPFDTTDAAELKEIRKWCNTPDAPVWMADHTFKKIGEIVAGDEVIGWVTDPDKWGSGKRQLVKTTVLATNTRVAPEVVEITFASGRVVRCTPDHQWLRYYAPGKDGRILNGPERSLVKTHESEYAPLEMGSIARHVVTPTEPLTDPKMIEALLSSNFGEPDEVVSIQSLGPGEVVSMQTGTGNYTAWGFASKNCRLFYTTHDLIPLLVDIYSKFPMVGMEFKCFAAETPVITDQGVMPIGELSGGIHRILTTGGKWVEAPFKSFGVQSLQRVTVQRNGRQREFYATPEHRWFIEEHHAPRLGRNSSKWSSLTWERVDAMRAEHAAGERQVDLAAKYGVSQVMVSKIVNHKAWTEDQRLAEATHPAPGWHKVEKSTNDLRPGMRLVSGYARNVIHDTNPSPFGIARGFVFGDGSRKASGRGSMVTLFGEKDRNLLPYFAGCTTAEGYYPDVSVESVTVTDLPGYFKDRPSLSEGVSYLYGWLSGYFAADGTVSKKGEVFLDSARKGDIEHARAVCQLLGIKTSDPYVIKGAGKEITFPGGNTFTQSEDCYRLRIANESLTEGFFQIPEHRARWAAHADRRSLDSWTVVSVEQTDRVEEVYCAVVPETEAFVLDGNILTGNCKDSKVKDFYESMFMDTLDYDTFLQDLGREYFISGEVNSLGHFDEDLGIFSSEEILNPDSIQVSKSMFVRHERVQLMVKDMVEALRESATAGASDDVSRSQQLEKNYEYQQLVENFPEIIEAAATDDGLDISDALISRIVNKVQAWDLRGTPHLLRSFRTLMMEESLNAAQDAVADRLYSPFILATLGIADLGDRQPWIPEQADLDETRDMMQDALAADFRLMVHNFGLKVDSVFGRESVPRFDQDYSRIDKKLMQAWGIGEALISGGSSSTYAGSALNREFVTQMMLGFQKSVRRHIRKRCEVIAEAQGHYDYEIKGDVRTPIMREIVEFDPATGENYTRKIPKLLIPDVEFSTLNLRDENQERQFLQTLKNSGVPISDGSLSVNIPIEFDEELEKTSEEKVSKLIAEAQAMKKAADYIKQNNLPIPPDLARYLAAQAQLDKEQSDADSQAADAQQQQQLADDPALALEMERAGQPPMAPGALPPGVPPGAGAPSPGGPPKPGTPGGPGGGDDGPPKPPSGGGGGDLGMSLDNGLAADQLNNSQPSPGFEEHPVNSPILDFTDEKKSPDKPEAPLVPRNRTRPEESDEQRKNSPRKSSFGAAPSSYGSVRHATQESVDASMKRLASPSQTVRDLVDQDEFFASLNRQGYADQIRADIDLIYSTMSVDKYGSVHLSGDGHVAEESFTVLSEMVEQYAEIFGFAPEWA